jgi:hypothetical protein
MIDDNLAKQLHDCATRGEVLSVAQQAELEEWYAFQDGIDSNTLVAIPATTTLATLQKQVEAALAQLMIMTKRIQEITAENEAIRLDIIALRRQLANLPTSHMAYCTIPITGD